MYIYKITNKINGKCYIGQTINNIRQRFNEHAQHKQYALGAAIKKYGKENFSIEQIDTAATIEELNEKEIYWISYHNSFKPLGYNIEIGGKNSPCSEYTKLRLSEVNSKPVIAINRKTKEETFYSSIFAAVRAGFQETSIRQCLKGRFVHHKNFCWKRPGQDFIIRQTQNELSKKPIKSKNIKTNEVLFYSSIAEAVLIGHKKHPLIRTLVKKKKSYNGCLWAYQNQDFIEYVVRNVKDCKSKKIIGTNIYTGEEKKYNSMSAAAREGFDRKLIYLCCNNKQDSHKNYIWKYEE